MQKIQDLSENIYKVPKLLFISLARNTKYSFADKMCWTWVPGEWRTEKRSSCGNIIVDFKLSSLQKSLLIKIDKCKNYQRPNHVNIVRICGLIMCAHNLGKSQKNCWDVYAVLQLPSKIEIKKEDWFAWVNVFAPVLSICQSRNLIQETWPNQLLLFVKFILLILY